MTIQECIGLPNQDGNTVLRSLPNHIRILATNQVGQLDWHSGLYFNDRGDVVCGISWLLFNTEKWECLNNS
jgi:hypothetical protein